MDQDTEQEENSKRVATRNRGGRRRVISVPFDSPTGWYDELGKYYANEWVIAIMDDAALDQGFERGEILAHGGEGEVTYAIRRYREKHPTSVLRIVPAGLLPRRLRHA